MARAPNRSPPESQLIGSLLRRHVRLPIEADKARRDLFKSISKSDRILNVLIRHVKTSDGITDRRNVVKELTDAPVFCFGLAVVWTSSCSVFYANSLCLTQTSHLKKSRQTLWEILEWTTCPITYKPIEEV
ncbi:hypothetical protein PHMEG_00011357 [Phytophthora megakarya]|uniref:Uncharacterized protein n=1 Tax=Phytophthora megakarya TaxID=4795 RepID=A0A225WBY1_9STRA|nr:hypothetical protein PHMEG_00011357 [Phytophthora megakarya]